MLVPKILIVAASSFELDGILNHFNVKAKAEKNVLSSHHINSKINLSVLITGVGMVNTAYYMGKYVNNEFDYIINAGVCGAINRDLQLGEVLHVITDTISELGAEDGEEFINYPDLNLGGTHIYKTDVDDSAKLFAHLKKVNGITVNTIHGSETTIRKVTERYPEADVESMEGAAFFRGCDGIYKPYLQVRAVSNYVETRDKSKWNLPLAINNLNETIKKIMDEINK